MKNTDEIKHFELIKLFSRKKLTNDKLIIVAFSKYLTYIIENRFRFNY